MKDLDSIDSFFTQAMRIVNHIRSYGETFGDQQVVEKILRSLPNKFDSRVTAIEESKDLSQLSIDELMGSLLSHEQRLNHSGTSSLENAFKTQLSFGRTRGRSDYSRGKDVLHQEEEEEIHSLKVEGQHQAHKSISHQQEEGGATILTIFIKEKGPGCSSVGYGAFAELGPFRVNSDGRTLRKNPNSWNTEANLLFLESPAGVGFSYSDNQSDYAQSGDARTAEDNYAFLVNWFQKYPKYKNRDFYIAGESYAGNYIPELAAKILTRKSQSQASFINLKGVMIGNGDFSITQDNAGAFLFAWSHALVSDETYNALVANCVHVPFINPNSTACQDLNDEKTIEMGNIDQYAIYSLQCSNGTGNKVQAQADQYDPCIHNYIVKYINLPEVQKAFHVKKTPVMWTLCSDTIFRSWNDYVPSVLPIYPQLISAGLRILIYCGDTDSVVPITGTRQALSALNLTIDTSWYPWAEDPTQTNGEVGGYSIVYKGNLTFASVRNAGHEVPLFEPVRILTLLRYYLVGRPPPPQ